MSGVLPQHTRILIKYQEMLFCVYSFHSLLNAQPSKALWSQLKALPSELVLAVSDSAALELSPSKKPSTAEPSLQLHANVTN